METRIVDARGLACPLPVVNTKKATAEMQQGGTVTVLVDNEIAVQNLQKFATQKGYESKAEKVLDEEYKVTITVTVKGSGNGETVAEEGALAGTVEESLSCQPDVRKKGMIAVLSANVMGMGDEKLGKALMKAFVFALTKQEQLPETILCYNTGAYLTCEGADTLEDMKNLEAEGVKILTCGTCLDFYGIKEKLAVGNVTNMYEIVEIMEQAKTIIRP